MSWEMKKFSALVAETKHSIVGGPFGSKLTSKDYVEDGVPVIRGANMSNGRYISETGFVFVSDEKKQKDLNSNLAKPGDMVFTQRGTLGQVALIPEDASYKEYVVSQSQMKATLDPAKADKQFYYYYFSSDKVVSTILNMTSSSGVPHINLGTLKDFDVPVPDLPTQERIASILSAYDDLIENNRRRIALLEQAAQLLYREWFVHFRFPGYETAKFVDGLPEGWATTALGEKAQILKGRNITKDTVNPGSVPVVAGGLKPAYFHDTANVKGPVVTISASGANAGHVAIYFDDIWASDCSYLSVTTNPDLFFIHQLLLDNVARIRAMQKGAAQPHVYPKDLQRMEVTLPTSEIIDQFIQLLDPIYSQIQALEKQNAQLTKARDLLLPRLMDGRIPVKV